jgi:hypothetical protein
MSVHEIKVRESDCWQHLRTVWFGAVSKQLNHSLANILTEDLKDLPSIYCFSTDIEDLLRCVEKEFGLPANYAKGRGSHFEQLMHSYHPQAYLYLFLVLAGGQDKTCV